MERSFWADGLDGERADGKNCLETLKAIRNVQIVSYGAWLSRCRFPCTVLRNADSCGGNRGIDAARASYQYAPVHAENRYAPSCQCMKAVYKVLNGLDRNKVGELVILRAAELHSFHFIQHSQNECQPICVDFGLNSRYRARSRPLEATA